MSESDSTGKKTEPAEYVRVVQAQEEIRVSGRTSVPDLAWSIVKTHSENKRVVLVGIGTQAVNQAVKAVAVANSRNASHGIVFTALPAMQDVKIKDDETGQEVERTVIKLTLLPYQW